MQFRVTFDILTESRTDTFLGSSRSDLQNLTAVVEAFNTTQAQNMVESMYGGRQNVVVKSVYQEY